MRRVLSLSHSDGRRVQSKHISQQLQRESPTRRVVGRPSLFARHWSFVQPPNLQHRLFRALPSKWVNISVMFLQNLDRTQHTEASEASFHTILFVHLWKSLFIVLTAELTNSSSKLLLQYLQAYRKCIVCTHFLQICTLSYWRGKKLFFLLEYLFEPQEKNFWRMSLSKWKSLFMDPLGWKNFQRNCWKEWLC